MDQYVSPTMAVTVCYFMVISPSPLKHKLSYGWGEMVSLHTIAIAGILLLSPFLDSSDDSGKSAYNNYCSYLFIFCFFRL